MGRLRKTGAELPKRVYLAHGAYYFIPGSGPKKGRRIHLGRTVKDAIARHAILLADAGIATKPGDPYQVSRMYRSSKASAKARNIHFLLTHADIDALLLRAGGRCELTGIYFTSEVIAGARRRPWIPSLDRIDAAKPYEFDNLRVVCTAVNLAINDFGLDVLLLIARKIRGKNISRREISGATNLETERDTDANYLISLG